MNAKKFNRPDWDAYFIDIAHVVKTRGNCTRRQVGAVVVKEERIVSTGYNGTPRGVTNCCDGGCKRCASDAPSGADLGECVCLHAEENAITQATYYGIALHDATLYCTLSPCLTCAKLIINAGIRKVIFEDEYELSEQTLAFLKEAGVTCMALDRSA